MFFSNWGIHKLIQDFIKKALEQEFLVANPGQ